MELFPFYCLALLFASLWVIRPPRARIFLLFTVLLIALVAGRMDLVAVAATLGLGALWLYYSRTKPLALFFAIIAVSYLFKYRLVPGFHNLNLCTNFWFGFGPPLIGYFPLALLVPLASTKTEWKEAFTRGLWLTIAGIAFMTLLALLSGTVTWQFKLPTEACHRYLHNLFLVSIPEEGFFRGFILAELCRHLQHVKKGNLIALILSALLFTGTHLLWSPNIAVLAFVFLAGLLYGGVYLISKRIESAILCHFLLNVTHMTFFTYHAM